MFKLFLKNVENGNGHMAVIICDSMTIYEDEVRVMVENRFTTAIHKKEIESVEIIDMPLSMSKGEK